VTIEPPPDCGFSVTVAGNEVTGQSKDVVSFQSADFQDGAIVGITLRQMPTETGRTCTLGSIIDPEFPRVLGPGPYVGAVGCEIGLQGTDTYFFSEIDMAPSLFISEYQLTKSLKGQLSGPIVVMGSPPDYPERWDSAVITFEVRVPPDYIPPLLGIYECVIP
jgi:hypothetical protein